MKMGARGAREMPVIAETSGLPHDPLAGSARPGGGSMAGGGGGVRFIK